MQLLADWRKRFACARKELKKREVQRVANRSVKLSLKLSIKLSYFKIYLGLHKVLWEVGRLAPDSLCNVYATSLHGPCNNKRTLYARSLHNEHSMHTPCTVSPCTVYARSMQRLCNVPARSLHSTI